MSQNEKDKRILSLGDRFEVTDMMPWRSGNRRGTHRQT
jgi:hypothetical protein